MSSEFRIIMLIVAALGLVAWAVRSWAGEMPIRGPVRMAAPPQLQTALVRSAAGASVRSVSGF